MKSLIAAFLLLSSMAYGSTLPKIVKGMDYGDVVETMQAAGYSPVSRTTTGNGAELSYADKALLMYPDIPEAKCSMTFFSRKLTFASGCNPNVVSMDSEALK